MQTKGIIPTGGSRRSSTSTLRFDTPTPPSEPTPNKKRKLEETAVGEGNDFKEEKIKRLEVILWPASLTGIGQSCQIGTQVYKALQTKGRIVRKDEMVDVNVNGIEIGKAQGRRVLKL